MSALAKTQKKKALEFVQQAENVLNKKSAFGSIFGQSASAKERQAEDAAELYIQAANAYKVGGMSNEAGEIYALTGALYRDKCNNGPEAAKCYTQAGTLQHNIRFTRLKHSACCLSNHCIFCILYLIVIMLPDV